MSNNCLTRTLFHLGEHLIPKRNHAAAFSELYNRLKNTEPFALARFGAVEIKAVIYGLLPWPLCLLLQPYVFKHIGNNAGFFPVERKSLQRFARLMVDAMNDVDILVSWRPEEFFFRKHLAHCVFIKRSTMGFVGSRYIWSGLLEGKRVLVVHPFAETIKRQYKENREKIWPKRTVLPKFKELIVINAVQSIADNKTEFKTWFEALDHMKHQIDKHEFDVALISCGAYGFPLAAHVCHTGRKAIHIGGSLQLLFGIKGKRWDHKGFYNEFWVSPSTAERPKGFEKVEGGCYW